jgi:hypothetical protein
MVTDFTEFINFLIYVNYFKNHAKVYEGLLPVEASVGRLYGHSYCIIYWT